MITSEPWTLLAMMLPITGGTLALSQFGLAGSGFRGSLQGGNTGLHFLTRRSGGFGHSMVARHAATLTSGGLGHLSLHAGQPGGAPCAGHTLLQAGFFWSNWNSSHGISASGMAASLGGSGTSS